MKTFRYSLLVLTQNLDGFLYGKGILHSEDAASASLKGVQMGSASQCLAKVTGKGSYIGSFAAGHSYYGSRQSQCRIVGHIDAARCGGVSGVENDPTHSFVVGTAPCSQEDSTVFNPTDTTASSRINVTDNSALGLPRAVIRMA